jgi:aromatic ring-opening dioxygenase LigB subunit
VLSLSVLIAGISPHPPLIIPEIGGREIDRVRNTADALEKLSNQVTALFPETVIFITPHGPVFRDAPAILAGEELQGDFRDFGVPGVSFRVQNDLPLVNAIAEESRKINISVNLLRRNNSRVLEDITSLDHGIMVPLYYLEEAGYAARCAAITFAMLPFNDLFRFGEAIKKAVEISGRRVAVIASGDLSHRLTRDAPAGYNPLGGEYDRQIVENVKNYNVENLLGMDKNLVSVAGECGLRSILIMLGILSGSKIKPEVLSYEGPFGVGYLVALLTPVKEEDT